MNTNFANVLFQLFIHFTINSSLHLDSGQIASYENNKEIGDFSRWKRTVDSSNCANFSSPTEIQGYERFVTPILGGLVPERIIRIKGFVPTSTLSCNITLQDSIEDFPEVNSPFHVSIHFPEKYILINSFENGEWGVAEMKDDLPIKAGSTFEIVISTTTSHYKLIIDGKHFCNFQHRIPVANVSHVVISTNLHLIQLSFDSVPTIDSELPAIYHSSSTAPNTTEFTVPIVGGFSPGKFIRIKAFTLSDTNRIVINLQAGPGQSNDVALHLSIRFHEKVLVRNSLENDAWKDEERDGELPINAGHDFDLVLSCDSSNYKISINGIHFCDFPQRIPADRVSHLLIGKDIYLTDLSFEEDAASRSGNSSTNAYIPASADLSIPVVDGLKEGKLIRFEGQTLITAEKFTVALLIGQSNFPNDIISLHFDVRLVLRYIARNSLKDGIWGDEEGGGDLPIVAGSKFEITISANSSDYKIVINGKHFCNFPTRISAKDVTHLLIYGDVYPTKLAFESDFSISLPPPKDMATLIGQSEDPPERLPLLIPIAGGFSTGKAIRIGGYTIVAHKTWFLINLKGATIKSGETDLQMSFQLYQHNAVVRPFKNGSLGTPVTHNNMTLVPGKHFEIIVLSDYPFFKIAIDGEHFTAVRQEISADCVIYLHIQGLVYITQLSLESNEPSSFGLSLNPYGKLPPGYELTL